MKSLSILLLWKILIKLIPFILAVILKLLIKVKLFSSIEEFEKVLNITNNVWNNVNITAKTKKENEENISQQ